MEVVLPSSPQSNRYCRLSLSFIMIASFFSGSVPLMTRRERKKCSDDSGRDLQKFQSYRWHAVLLTEMENNNTIDTKKLIEIKPNQIRKQECEQKCRLLPAWSIGMLLYSQVASLIITPPTVPTVFKCQRVNIPITHFEPFYDEVLNTTLYLSVQHLKSSLNSGRLCCE